MNVIRLLAILLILFIGPVALAQSEWSYSQFPIVSSQSTDLLPGQLIISKVVYRGMMPRGSGTHPLWGVEQVYSDRQMTKRLFVKRDVRLTTTGHSGWMKVGGGYVLHLKQGTKLNAFYALGFDAHERLEVEHQLRGIYKTASMMDYVFPKAYAGEVLGTKAGDATAAGAPAASKGASESEGSEGLTMCIGKMTGQILKNKVTSAYNTTADAVSYAYNDKIGAAKAVGSYVASTASGVWETTKSVASTAGNAVVHPVDAWGNVVSAVDSTRKFGNEIYQRTSSAIQDFPTWPQPVKDAITCSIAAELTAGGAEMIAGMISGVGQSMAAIRAAKLLASIYEKIKVLSPLIKTLIAAKDINWGTRLELLKDLVKGTKTREEVELALHKSSGAAEVAKETGNELKKAADVAKDAAKPPDLKALSPKDLAQLQAKNRALGDTERMAAIEKQLGLAPGSLTDAQKKKLLEIHNKPCAETKCTAQEIRDIKDLKGVRELFPNASAQNIKNLYRGNLLGYEKDPELAALLKQSFKPREVVDEGAQLRSTLDAHTAELHSATADVAKLHADLDHSPIAMADAKHRQANLQASVDQAQRDVRVHSLNTAPAATGHDADEFKDLLKQSFKPRNSEPHVASAEHEAAVKAKELKRGQEAHDLMEKLEAAKKAAHEPITTEDTKQFDELLKKSFKPEGTAKSAAEKLDVKLKEATIDHPVTAKYVSPKTGEIVRADIIGVKDPTGTLDAHGAVNHDAKVLVRTMGPDGRTVTREVALRDLAFGKGDVALRDQGGATGVDHAVDRIVQKATSHADEIQALNKQSDAAFKSGEAFRPGSAWDKAETDLNHLLKADQPLTHAEVRHVEAVHEAFTAENIAKRMPLDITKTGSINIRPSGSMNQAGLTKAEKRDLASVKKMVEARNHSPKAIEDVQHFEKIKNLDEKKIVLGRIQAQQTAANSRMRAFTQTTNCCALPANIGMEYRPAQLVKVYSASNTNALSSLQKVQKLLSKPEITSREMSEVRDELEYLRGPRMPESARNDVNLNRFLDYAADRAGSHRLDELRQMYNYNN